MERKRVRKASGHRRCKTCDRDLRHSLQDCHDPEHMARVVEYSQEQSARYLRDKREARASGRWDTKCPDCFKGMRSKPDRECTSETHYRRYSAHLEFTAKAKSSGAKPSPYLLAWYGEGPRPTSGSLCPGCMGRQVIKANNWKMRSCPVCTPTLKQLVG